jgi:hypothetical protein
MDVFMIVSSASPCPRRVAMRRRPNKKPVQLAAERVSVEGRFSCIY